MREGDAVARPAQEPTFLPLTISTAGTVSADPRIHTAALRADAAAAECWAALLAGCDAPGRRQLPWRLRELADETLMYAGPAWWNGAGFGHRTRIGQARVRLEEAVSERDGAEFAEAFVGYDQAVATALVRAHNTTRMTS